VVAWNGGGGREWWEHTLTVTRHEKVYWNDEHVL